MRDAPVLTAVGGGTGPLPILAAMKRLTRKINAVIANWDNGGSSKILLDEYGGLPPGDLRQAILALMEDDEASLFLREFFNYRPADGPFAKHPPGSILLSLLTDFTQGDGIKAIEVLSRLLRVIGRVIPVSDTRTHLSLRLPDGIVINGEDEIGENCAGKSYFSKGICPELFISPSVKASDTAIAAIEQSDLVVLCPGKIYTSVGPHLLFEGVVEALIRARHVVYFPNLMTQPGQTDGFRAVDFVRALHALAGAEFIRTVVCNTAQPDTNLIAKYAAAGEEPVVYSRRDFRGMSCHPVGAQLLSDKIHVPQRADSLRRTLIRHDPQTMLRVIRRLMKEGPPK